jgi:hypothetical protein
MKEAIEQFRTHYWSRELDAAFVAFGQIRAGALVVGADPLFNTERVQLVTLAARHALPVSYFQRDHVEAAVATPWLAGPSLANLLPDDLLAKGEGGLEMPLPNFLMPHMQFNLIAAPLGGAAAGSKKLNVSVTPQQQTNWCWAAVSTSVSHFYSSASGWSQCTVANAALPRTDCCGVGAPDPLRCNRPWYLDKALHVTGNLDRVGPKSRHWVLGWVGPLQPSATATTATVLFAIYGIACLAHRRFPLTGSCLTYRRSAMPSATAWRTGSSPRPTV